MSEPARRPRGGAFGLGIFAGAVVMLGLTLGWLLLLIGAVGAESRPQPLPWSFIGFAAVVLGTLSWIAVRLWSLRRSRDGWSGLTRGVLLGAGLGLTLTVLVVVTCSALGLG